MIQSNYTTISRKWLHLLLGVVLFICFFLPWASWNEITVSGYYIPAGKFFHIAETNFGLGNPFPQFNFLFYSFWLIPILIILTIVLVFQNKKSTLTAFIVGALTLSLVTVYFLFTSTLIDLGVGHNVFCMLQLPVYITAASAVGFILTVLPGASWLKKMGWFIVGPVFAISGFLFIENYLKKETFSDTVSVKADYTVNAPDLIREFAANDSTANIKYREKIIVINGVVSDVERLSDSSTNFRFSDTTGSYAIFSFDKMQLEKIKNIKTGDRISLKGSCSGSIFSEILGITSISFKRCALNKTTMQ